MSIEPYRYVSDETKDKAGKVRFEIAIRGNEHLLHDAWEKHFRPNIAYFAHKLEPILTAYLQQAHYLLRATGLASEYGDAVSYHRSAVEAHEEDTYINGADVLIDSARDVIEHLVKGDHNHVLPVIEDWASSDVPMLKRLAIHGVAEDAHLTPDQKLDWLLEKAWLYALGLKHEVFRLLQIAFPAASESVHLRVLDEAESGFDYQGNDKEEREIRQYETYYLLYWLSSVAPDCESVMERFRAVQEAHPDFCPREHPDLISWSTTEWTGHQSPITVDELLSRPPANWTDWLLNYKGEVFTGPDRQGLLSAVSEAVARSFDWGYGLAEALRSRGELATDLWRMVLRGWQISAASEEQWGRMLALMNVDPMPSTSGGDIAELLRHGIENSGSGVISSLIPLAENVAEKAYDGSAVLPMGQTESEDWLFEALNHAGGKIALFWLHALSRRQEESGDKLGTMPDNYKRYFEKLLSGISYAAQMGRVMLASQSHFLFALDPNWTREKILPLFDWARDATHAQQAWHGYLAWGRWNAALLPDLMPYFEISFSQMSAGLSSKRDLFCRRLAEIAILGQGNPLHEGWLNTFIRESNDEDRRRWASHVRLRLRALPEEAKQLLWERWIRDYWAQRINGIPLGESESREMVGWAIDLDSVFPDVVQLVVSSEAPDLKLTYVYDEFEKKNLAERYPVATATLLQHILSGAHGPFSHCETIASLVRKLADLKAPVSKLKKVCEHLARLGCPQAPQLRQQVEAHIPYPNSSGKLN